MELLRENLTLRIYRYFVLPIDRDCVDSSGPRENRGLMWILTLRSLLRGMPEGPI